MFGLTPYNRRNSGIDRRPMNFFDVESFFDNWFNDAFFPTIFSSQGQMKVDIKENDREYIVEAELPGVQKEEINLELQDDRLTISVVRNEEVKEEKADYIRRERRYGSMSRSFYVDNIANEKVRAKFENGVLSIILPKKEPGKMHSRKIDIQ